MTLPQSVDRIITKLTSAHDVSGFDCGHKALNRFLILHALNNQRADDSQTWVALISDQVVGYYTLVVGSVEYADAARPLQKGHQSHRSIPIMLLARLAVDKRWQGQGIGKTLLQDAILRTVQAADLAGIAAITVHAKDQNAREFYEHFGFSQSPTDPLHLFITLKDVRASM